MNYLFLGVATADKEKSIIALREEILPADDSQAFDYEVLYAAKLPPAILKERLIALPTLARQRVLVIHQVEEFSAAHKDIVTEFLASGPKHVVLVLTSDTLAPQDAFVQKIKFFFKVQDFGRKPERTVFEVTNALDRKDVAGALQILNDLLDRGEHPLQIMGGIVWFWRTKRNRLPSARFESGLEALQEADVNIKRSRLTPDQAVETLLVKLGTILK